MQRQIVFVDKNRVQLRDDYGTRIIENAHVVIKRVGRKWLKVLMGTFRVDIAGRIRVWKVQLVIGAISLTEKLITAAQSFFKSIFPEHFMFRVKAGNFDVALAW